MILGKQLIESYEEDERLFSTGDSELDDILEEVYYSGLEDGYDYAQREFAEKEEKKGKDKMKFGDRMNVRRLKSTYKGRKGDEYLKLHLDQVDPDPEVRKKGIKKAAVEGLKAGAKATAVIVPAMAVTGGSINKAYGGSFKDGAKAMGGGALLGAGIGTAAGMAGFGATGIQNRMAAKGNKAADKGIRKTRDQILVASNKMDERDYIKKWGGKLDGEKVKGSENKKSKN